MSIKRNIVKIIKSNLLLYKIFVSLHSWMKKLSTNSNLFRRIVNLLLGRKDIVLHSTMSFRQYCDESCLLPQVLEEEKECIVFHAPYFEDLKSGFEEKIVTPSIYYVDIPDSCVIGGHEGIVVENNIYINDKFSLPHAYGINFKKTDGLVSEHGRQILISVSKKVGYVSEAFFLLGVAANNYYHFVNDICSRMAYLPKLELLRRGGVLLLDETVGGHKSYLDFLKRVNPYGLQIKYVKDGERIRVGKLHYISPSTFGQVYRNDCWKRENGLCFAKKKTVMMYYRSFFLPSHSELLWPKRLFITRGADKFKRLVNEHDCAHLSTQYGFTCIDPGRFNIDEQVQIWNNAEIVIGDEGAAFVNVMFGSSNTLLVSIMPKEWDNCQFTTIANEVGVKCINLDASLIDAEKRTHMMDLCYFERFLKSLPSISDACATVGEEER